MSTGKERLNKLLEAVIAAQLFPEQRPLEQAQLRALVRILACISIGIDARELFGIAPFRSKGRPNNEYLNTWLVADFLLRKRRLSGIRSKALCDDVARAWITTPNNVQKLASKHRKAACELIETAGEAAVARALRVAHGIRSGAVETIPRSAKARSAAMLCVFHLADQLPKND